MEALRRLRRNSTDTNVDRRLVTNVLLSFLATPRADPKRFEMLSLLATVLSWTDPEREKAGLQRAHNEPPASGNQSFWSRSPAASPAKELDKEDETEVFNPSCFGLVSFVLGITVIRSTVIFPSLGRIPPYGSSVWRYQLTTTTTER